MEVKEILDKIRQPGKEPREHYLAVEIGFHLVKSALWFIENGQIKVVAVGSIQAWEKEDAIVEAVDASLSTAMENFTPAEGEPEPGKVIFGLPDDWVEGEKIQPEKLQVLKDISQKMEFEPVGFVVTTEAINHYLKETEGVPPTAILIGLTARKLFVSLLRLGKIRPTQAVDRSENLGDDVLEGLSRLGEEEEFPSRILFYDGQEDLEKARQELVSYPWQAGDQKIAFLHLPKTEILPADFDIRAVAIAGGKEVARAAGVAIHPVEKEAASPVSPSASESGPPAKATPVTEEITNFAPVDFGFVKNQDIAKVAPMPETVSGPTAVPEPATVSAPVSPPSFPTEKPKPSLFSRLKLPKINFAFLRTLKSPRLSSPSFGGSLKHKPLLVGIVVLVLLFLLGLGGVFAYWRLPKASIVLLLEPRPLEDEFEVILDPELTTASPEGLTLPAQQIETEIEGTKTVPATGTKLTGEPAKGEVTIYNDTAQRKTFAEGTVIASASGLEFTLDEAVEIASKSGTAADSEPGRATVGVTAVEIGHESNLASGTEFAVANYAKADYLAKNDNAFSGGTSREVAVVAESDRQDLLAALTAELETAVIEKLRAQVGGGQSLIEESVQSEVVEKSFNAEADEEADKVTLTLGLTCRGLTYRGSEMDQLVVKLIRDEVPPGYEYREEESETSFSLNKMNKDGTAVFGVSLKASLLPIVDLEKINQDIAGKSPMTGKTYLENLSNVSSVEILITPNLPAKLLTFPRLPRNITIETRVP